jgi:hypothetical protein
MWFLKKFYFIHINFNLNSHIWLVVTTLDTADQAQEGILGKDNRNQFAPVLAFGHHNKIP